MIRKGIPRLTGAILASTSMAAITTPAFAQSVAIPAQPLASALSDYARQTHQELLFAPALVQGKRAPAVKGTMPSEVALRRLLNGTGLEFHAAPGGAFLLYARARRQEQEIPSSPPAVAPGQGATTTCPALATPNACPPVATPPAERTATEANAALGATGNDIVVTAQRREQRLQDVPISASVQSGASLDHMAVHTLEDMTSRLPDVRIAQVPGSDSINIRGVGSGNDAGFEQSVGTFVDGIYRGRSRSSRLGFFDVERIEVLRGPQTTFFGNNAIAGALNITTRKPGDRFEYNASALYAPTDGEYSFDGGVTLPLTDTFSVRAAGRWSGMNGYIHDVTLHNHGPHLNDKLGRLSLRWTPSSTVEINARIDHGHLSDRGNYDSELLDCPADPVFGPPRGACGRYLAANGGHVDDQLNYRSAAPASYQKLDYTEAAVNISVDLGGASLTSLTGYYQHNFRSYSTVLPIPGSSASVTGTESGLPLRVWEKFHQFSQEIRLTSTGTRKLDYMVGAYFSISRLDYRIADGYYFAPFGALSGGYYSATTPIAIFASSLQHDRTLSAFGATTLHLGEKLRLNTGLRYSIVHKRGAFTSAAGVSDDNLYADEFVPAPPNVQAILLPAAGASSGDYADPRRTDKKLMFSANVQYDLNRDAMAYASYARGFKAGGYGANLTNAEFGPESVDAFEVGLKASMLDHRVTFSIAAFLSKYKDLQEATFTINNAGIPFGSIGNVARSTSKGIEFGGSARIMRGLVATTDIAYLSARYDKYPLAPCTNYQSVTRPNCTQDLSGKPRAYAPKFSGNVGLNYTTSLTDALELRVAGSMFFTSGYFEQTNNDPLSRQPAYTKFDARIGIGPSDHRWEIAVIGKNLTDTTTASYRSSLPSSPGSYQGLVDRPRSVAVQFSIQN